MARTGNTALENFYETRQWFESNTDRKGRIVDIRKCNEFLMEGIKHLILYNIQLAEEVKHLKREKYLD